MKINNIIEWINVYRPGIITEEIDKVKIIHSNGEHSILWKIDSQLIFPEKYSILKQFYEDFDGMDLFSSTFKIASIINPKIENNVTLTFSINEINNEYKKALKLISEPSIVFMHQAGIGMYALGMKTNAIYEYDDGYNKITNKYKNIFEIIYEWHKALEE